MLQTALAAGLAWLVARHAVGHHTPFFAPIAAAISLGVVLGRRTRRAVEVVLGVALGVLVGDALIYAIGVETPQIVLVVALAMTAALLLGGGPIVVSQAASSAILVATLRPPSEGIYFSRFVDALIGGGMALAVNAAVPLDPVRRARRAAEPVLRELGATLDDVATALAARDVDAAYDALERARAIEDRQGAFREALDVGRETARLVPPRRRTRERVALYLGAAPHIDLTVRNVRALARAAIRAIELDDPVPAEVVEAIRLLAVPVRVLGRELQDRPPGEDPRRAAMRAAGEATLAFEREGNLSVSALVGAIRNTAVDLLRALGADRTDARRSVQEAARVLEEEGWDGDGPVSRRPAP